MASTKSKLNITKPSGPKKGNQGPKRQMANNKSGRNSMPVAYTNKSSSNLGNGIVISHKELFTTLSGTSVPFVLLGSSAYTPGYDLNPGSSTMFPWLSGIANGFEKFRFESVRLDIVPRNPTTVGGQVYAAFDYDFNDPVAKTAVELMTNRGAVSSDVWSPCSLVVDMARANADMPFRYVDNTMRNDEGARWRYPGYFMIAIAGCAAAVSFDVFIVYTVRLSLPAMHTLTEAVGTVPVTMTLPAATAATFPNLPSLHSTLESVSIGVDTPTLGGYTSGLGYRIATAAKGAFQLIANLQTAAAAPSTYDADTYMGASVYDSKGTLLLSNLSTVNGLAEHYPTPTNLATWDVANGAGRHVMAVEMAAIRAVAPLAAYIVPWLISTAGRVVNVLNPSVMHWEL